MTLIDNLRERLAAAQPRPVDAMPIEPVGWQAHQEGVDKLLASFRAVPAGKRVRLAKKTSNLFRSRSEEQEGLDGAHRGGGEGRWCGARRGVARGHVLQRR